MFAARVLKPSLLSTFARGVLIGTPIALAVSFSSWSASFDIDHQNSLTLSGEIRPGDAERAIKTILAIQPISKDNYRYPSRLVVNSRGGDVGEALRLASLVKAGYVDVSVLPRGKGVCASSCFFIFLAGQERNASGIDTIAREGAEHSLGPVGVHRPYYLSMESGPAATKQQEDLMRTVAALLHDERVPQAIVDTMMAHPSNDIYWLNSEQLATLGVYRAGVEEELVKNCGYSAKREQQMSAREFIRDVQRGARACASDHLRRVYGPLRDEAFKRLRSGWRPWTP